jgi:hypothetical protein
MLVQGFADAEFVDSGGLVGFTANLEQLLRKGAELFHANRRFLDAAN